MKECRFCGKPLEAEDAICVFCGYDPKTDTISPSFNPHAASFKSKRKKMQMEQEKTAGSGRGINQKVKKFAFVGLGIVIFSILYKYNFNINVISSEISQLFTGIKTGKFIKGKSNKKKENKAEKIEFINVRIYEKPKKTTVYKDLVVEGIFFNTDGKNFVIINGNVISEGESFQNVTVKKINRDSVEVIIGGENEVLGLNQSIPLPKK